jgi:hypothetical protein
MDRTGIYCIAIGHTIDLLWVDRGFELLPGQTKDHKIGRYLLLSR